MTGGTVKRRLTIMHCPLDSRLEGPAQCQVLDVSIISGMPANASQYLLACDIRTKYV